MFSLPIRVVLITALGALGIYRLFNGQPLAVLLLISAALFAFGYFRYGAIRPAFMAMRRGDIQTARKHLNSIRFPKLLSAESRAYFHWVTAILALNDSGDTDFAVEQMQLAIDGKLRTANDRCVALVNLAHIVGMSGDVEEAEQILARAEQIPHREKAAIYLNEVKSQLRGEPSASAPGA